MSQPAGNIEPPAVTHSRLVKDLSALGVARGQLVMLHASVKSIGWVVGGPDVVLSALFEVLGPEGTLMMVVGWEDSTYEMDEWPAEKRQAYHDECPAFDPSRSRACRNMSILTEYLRTWPGARRSGHPDCSYAAVGPLADWIVRDHPLQYGHGVGSPLAKLCEAGGSVLLLGSPLVHVTLLHYAECLADVPGKRVVRYRAPVLRDGRRVWVELEEYDTCNGIVGSSDQYFPAIMEAYLTVGHGRSGLVGHGRSYLFHAPHLTRFAVEWMERHLRGKAPAV